MNRIHRGGFGLVVVVGSLMAVPAFGQGMVRRRLPA